MRTCLAVRSWAGAGLAGLLLAGLLLAGCTTVRDEAYTHYAPVDSVDVPLRTDGYYCRTDTLAAVPGTLLDCLVLWADGTVADLDALGAVVRPRDGVIDTPDIEFGTEGQAHRAVQKTVGNQASMPTWGQRDGVGPDWGGYRVDGDSISIQVFENRVRGFAGKRYVPWQYEGMIRNDTTFVLTRYDHEAGGEGMGPVDSPHVYHFHPFDRTEKPPSDNWTHRYGSGR